MALTATIATSVCTLGKPLRLPPDEELHQVVAEVCPNGWNQEVVQPFVVEARYASRLVALVGDAKPYDYPAGLDGEPLVRLTIRSRSGESWTLVIPAIGKVQLHLRVRGIHYVRAGPYTASVKPLDVGYAAESLLLAAGIKSIREEQEQGKDVGRVAWMFDVFDRSMGKKPPFDN